MVSPRIFKTKFYLCRKVEKGYRVLHEIGPFDTESKAHLYMCQEVTPGSRLMERKPEFAGVMTQRGAHILSRPKVYNLTVEEETHANAI